MQVLGVAVDAFAQGVAYFHAGIDILRSKSLDRNSFDSGDWFNRLDWTLPDNYFGTGLPPAPDNGKDWALMKPLLAESGLQAGARRHRLCPRRLPRLAGDARQFHPVPPAHRCRRSRQRLRFFNTGAGQEPTVAAAHLDGQGYPGAGFKGVSYFINVDKVAHTRRRPASRRQGHAFAPGVPGADRGRQARHPGPLRQGQRQLQHSAAHGGGVRGRLSRSDPSDRPRTPDPAVARPNG